MTIYEKISGTDDQRIQLSPVFRAELVQEIEEFLDVIHAEAIRLFQNKLPSARIEVRGDSAVTWCFVGRRLVYYYPDAIDKDINDNGVSVNIHINNEGRVYDASNGLYTLTALMCRANIERNDGEDLYIASEHSIDSRQKSKIVEVAIKQACRIMYEDIRTNIRILYKALEEYNMQYPI